PPGDCTRSCPRTVWPGAGMISVRTTRSMLSEPMTTTPDLPAFCDARPGPLEGTACRWKSALLAAWPGGFAPPTETGALATPAGRATGGAGAGGGAAAFGAAGAGVLATPAFLRAGFAGLCFLGLAIMNSAGAGIVREVRRCGE